jgi:hypothetical protein
MRRTKGTNKPGVYFKDELGSAIAAKLPELLRKE